MSELHSRTCPARSCPHVRRSSLRLRHCIASKRQRRTHHSDSPARRTGPRASAGTSSFDEMEVAKLPFSSRQAVMQALDALGRSATAAEVASKAGLPIQDTERCLQAIASESSGSMKVTSSGDIIYVFPGDYRARLQQRSAALRTEEFTRATTAALLRGARVAFGVALISSIIFAAVAITAISASSSSSDDRRSGGGPGFTFWVDPFDVWYLTDGSARRRRERELKRKGRDKKEENGVLVFLEDAFRIVFGGPDPNAGLEEARWKAVGARILERGGVVAAEELRPLLDVTPAQDEDESYMLPVLLRLNGSVEVSDAGEMLYTFPDLQRRAARLNAGRPGGAFRAAVSWVEGKVSGKTNPEAPYLAQQGDQQYLAERQRAIFDVRPSSAAPLAAFVAINGLLVSTLASLAADPAVMQGLQSSSPEFASLIMFAVPLLTAYASLYIIGPLVRSLGNLRGNARAAQSNALRQKAAAELEAPSPTLQEKLRRARSQHRVIDVTRESLVFDTAAERAPELLEADEWDSRFSRRRDERGR